MAAARRLSLGANTLLFVASLSAAALAADEFVPDFRQPPVEVARPPTGDFLTVEVIKYGLGLAWPPGGEIGLVRFTYSWSRWRAGIAGPSMLGFLGGGDPYLNMGGALASAHFGRTFSRRLKPTAFFYGLVPDYYVEGSFGWGDGPTAKLCGGLDVNYWGVGAGAELGVLTTKIGWGSRYVTPYLFVYLKAGCWTFRVRDRQ